MTRTSRFALALTFLAVTTLAGCSSSDGTCASDSDCDANQYCVIEEGVCDDELAPLPGAKARHTPFVQAIRPTGTIAATN